MRLLPGIFIVVLLTGCSPVYVDNYDEDCHFEVSVYTGNEAICCPDYYGNSFTCTDIEGDENE